jgi:D-alanyl-D-alanine carboxypeptidase
MTDNPISRRKAIGGAVVAVAATKSALEAQPLREDRAQFPLPSNVQMFIEGFAPEKIVGMTLAVTDGTRSWVGGSGYSNLPTKTSIAADDAIGIGSITKTFLAVVAMQLHEAGRLSLDDTAEKYHGRKALPKVANIGQASISQLMEHTSGIPSPEDDPAWIRDARGAGLNSSKIWSPLKSLAYVFDKPALSAPGFSYNYSNANYTILGLVIEKITGNTLWHEIETRICKQLDLRHTWMDGISRPLGPTRVASRYHYLTRHFEEVAGIPRNAIKVRDDLIDVSMYNWSCEWGDGDIISTAPDVAAFFSGLRSGRLVGSASLAFMTTWRQAGSLGHGQFFYAGHGLFRQAAGAHSIIGHTGGVLGATANAFWIEGTSITYAALSNVGVEDIGEQRASVNSVGQNPQFVNMLITLAKTLR